MKVFISYATVDLKSFRIPEIVDFLESQNYIEKVYYWDRDCDSEKSIITYMEECIQICDKIIFFCSENTKNSASVREELEMATFSHKNMIPVFRDLEDVSLILRPKKGTKFEDNDFQGFLEKLFFNLTGKKFIPYLPKKMEEIIPIFKANGEFLGKVSRKEIHEKPLWHKTTLVFVIHPNGKVLYIKRSDRSRISPGLFDCFGGHLIAKDKENIRKAAKRELAEELNISEDKIKNKDLIQIGKEDQFKVAINKPRYNYEMSTLFLFFIGKDLISQETIITQESIGDDNIQLFRYADYLDSLVEKFNQDPSQFADGISRILPQEEILNQINEVIHIRREL